MSIKYEVRQHVNAGDQGRLETICSSDYERTATMAYEDYVHRFPGRYFELIKVEHQEECLKFTKRK